MDAPKSFTCPCCGHETLTEPPTGTFEICSLCGWEDAPTQAADESYAGGANGVSLREARAEARRLGLTFARPEDPASSSCGSARLTEPIESVPSPTPSLFRRPTTDEERLLRALAANAGTVSVEAWIAHLRVRSMEDGGMGSLQFDVPHPSESTVRSTVTCLASMQFTDADGVDVIASLHAGADGVPFELDIWKTDFSRLVRIPTRFVPVER